MSASAANSAAPRIEWHWWLIALMLAAYGGFGLEYTKHIVRHGSGLWTPEAIIAALSHRSESLFPLLVGTVWIVILALRMPLPSSRADRFKRLLGLKIVPVLALVVICRSYIIDSLDVWNDSAAPEIPRGSHLLVWKLSSAFAPGDMIAYSNGGQTFLGRVVSASDVTVTVHRNDQSDIAVQRPCIEGKVISVYWRGSSDVKAEGANSFHIYFLGKPLSYPTSEL